MQPLAPISWLALVIAQSSGTVVTVLPPAAIKTLTGCWSIKADPDRWFFHPHGATGLDAAVEDTFSASTRHLGAPHAVMFDPSANTFAFVAAGMHHPLLVIFTIEGAQLKAWYYSRHNSRGYHWTGNTASLARCPS